MIDAIKKRLKGFEKSIEKDYAEKNFGYVKANQKKAHEARQKAYRHLIWKLEEMEKDAHLGRQVRRMAKLLPPMEKRNNGDAVFLIVEGPSERWFIHDASGKYYPTCELPEDAIISTFDTKLKEALTEYNNERERESKNTHSAYSLSDSDA